ncbi:MAG: autotransporter-associated beta strand repeat-containing protein, partial [Patescibacteria group bacterium]|nr:autotransporter-associated beta strand repeat-containing protein [Patescibacteria group bacterium]
MKAIHSRRTALVLASSLAVAWVCLTPAAVQAATVYQWNGSADSVFTNTANWSGGNVAPTGNAPDTLNYRLTVNNSNNPLTYTAAQGHTIYASDERSLFIGTGASGSMTITGGIFESRAKTEDGMANTSGTASLTIAGGEYRNTEDNTAGNAANTFLVMYGSGGTGNLNINSGLFSVTTLRYQGDTTTGNVYLNGGTLEAGTITDTGGNSNFFFNGGVLKPLASTTSFLQELDSAQIQAGGAKVDTSSFDVTIAQNLLDGGGGGGLTKQGDGTLTLSGTNTYTGNTLVYIGTLRLAGGDNRLPIGTILDLNTAVGSGAVIDLNGTDQEVAGLTNGNSSYRVTNLDGGNASTLTVNTSSASSFAGVLGGNLSLAKKGDSSLTLSGESNYSGATNVAEGTLAISTASNRLPTGTVLQMGSAADTGSAIFDLGGQNQQVAGLASLGSTMTMEVTNSSTDPATLTVNNAAAYDYAGTLTENLGLTKSGGGFLELSAANSYTGATNVTAGTLKLKHDGALGNTSGVSITANATLLLDNGITAGAGKTVSVRGNGHNGTYGALRGSAGTSTWEGDVLLADDNARLGTDNSGTLVVTGKLSSAPSTSHGLVLRTSHNGGTVVLKNAGNDYLGSTLIYIGTLRLDGGDNTLPTGTLLDFNTAVSGSTSRLDLFGNDQEVSGLISGSAAHGVTNSD